MAKHSPVISLFEAIPEMNDPLPTSEYTYPERYVNSYHNYLLRLERNLGQEGATLRLKKELKELIDQVTSKSEINKSHFDMFGTKTLETLLDLLKHALESTEKGQLTTAGSWLCEAIPHYRMLILYMPH